MYTHNEKVDMLLIYGEARKNGLLARRLYAERYPERNLPNYKLFSRLENNLRQNPNAFLRKKLREKTVTTDENVANILNYFEANHNASIREASRDLNLKFGVIQRVLKANKFHDYKLHMLQELSVRDFERRENFVCQFLVALSDDPNLFSHILWTDESHFLSHGKPNRKNTHYWSDENPHIIHTVQNQGHFGINVWCGIVGRHLVGPYFYEGPLTGQRYLEFLRNQLPLLLENVPLLIRQNLWLQMDGAPCHNAEIVRNYLNRQYRDKWIGTYGPMEFPPRSPDLTPLDFFLWGAVKNMVYKTKSNNIEQLKLKISDACASIRGDILRKVTFNKIREIYNKCLDNNGGHVEHLLK